MRIQREWHDAFLTRLRACFEAPQNDLMYRGVELLDADLDGNGLLRVVYTHPLYADKLGLIRRLDPSEQAGAPEPVAVEVAAFEVSEPLGNYVEQLGSPDTQRVRWWSPAEQGLQD